MSENIIYCYSGSGHCLDMAKKIAKVLGDTDIVMMRSAPEITDATEAKRVGFIFSCMAGGLPGNVEEYVKSVKIAPGAYKFAVEQYAGYLGCGLRKIDDMVGLDYWNAVPNHSTAIWLMPHKLTRAPKSVKASAKKIDRKALEIGGAVRVMSRSEKKPPKETAFKLMSNGLGKTHGKRVQKFNVSDQCTKCGICAKVCPKHNIDMSNGWPIFGRDCIGCLSCIQYCKPEAINIGKITRKRERFPNRNVSPMELIKPVIHID